MLHHHLRHSLTSVAGNTPKTIMKLVMKIRIKNKDDITHVKKKKQIIFGTQMNNSLTRILEKNNIWK